MPTGCFHPYWKPRIKGIGHPFEIPARFEICIYKPGKRCLHLHIPKRKNPHSRSSSKERKDCGDFGCRIHRNGKISCVTHRCGGAFYAPRSSLRPLDRVQYIRTVKVDSNNREGRHSPIKGSACLYVEISFGQSEWQQLPEQWLQHLHYPDVRRLWQTTRDVLR